MRDVLRLRVRPEVLQRLRTLQETTGLSFSRLTRNILFGRPVVPKKNTQLWMRLSRSAANLTQLEAHLESSRDSSQLQELLHRVHHAQQILQLTRNELIAYAPLQGSRDDDSTEGSNRGRTSARVGDRGGSR